MKKVNAGIIRRVRAGWPVGFGTISFLYTIVAFFPPKDPLRLIEVLVGCFVVGFYLAYWWGSSKHLPDEVFDDRNSDRHYVASICTADNLKRANELSRPFFSRECVSNETAELWRLRNPMGFVQILNARNELCAVFGIHGIRENFMQLFVEGRIEDTNLQSDDILPLKEAKKSSSLYITGVMVCDPDSHICHKRASVMVWCMTEYLCAAYGKRKSRIVYALAVTKPSEAILKKFGFYLCGAADQRDDGFNLYSIEFNKATLAHVLERVGDLSPMCECNFKSLVGAAAIGQTAETNA